ncbi:Hypothetical protein R9X50_00787900 [Acrodontium crateriforme]|uniref:LisH domain-containing protein n=1 Tax=Acrodontium crateriforme TaxID=150365 RepID=A0AAQ3RCJ9_9PEZI|nr:Hypothetical protein R9X50_00787900 [Acrodontium crateriforme]
MAAGVLHSDHINYLILRYLQEAGHENAAEALYRDWRRPYEYRDPESLPFARTVKRHELISVVQEGLRHDELMSRVSDHGRQFRWTLDHADETTLENGTSGSRPVSRGWKKNRGSIAMRAPDEFPTPVAKRQRRSEGSDGIHLNGDRDAMDVDATSTADVEGEYEGDALASPAIGSEVEVVEAPERYDSMDISTQTDVPDRPKPVTILWNVDKPNATILHNIWNSDKDPKNANTLLTVGEGLCRLYQIPEKTSDAKQMSHLDDPNMPSNSIITATAWHPEGHTATCAVDSIHEHPDGKQKNEQFLINHNRDRGSSIIPSGPSLLSPPGVVLCLRYSPDGSHLIDLRTNMKRGLVQIWKTPDSNELPTEPVAWRVFEHPVFDACWRTNSSFVVCGDSILDLYELNFEKRIYHAFTAETIAIQGLTQGTVLDMPSERKWEKLRLHSNNGPTVVASSEDGNLLAILGGPDFRFYTEIALPEGQLTGLAFSSMTCHNRPRALLAAAFVEGFCNVYAIPTDLSKAAGVESRPEELTLELAGGPALALAWSPSGKYLAVGGTQSVQIWQEDTICNALFFERPSSRNGDAATEDKSLVPRKNVRSPSANPLITWHPDAGSWSIHQGRNGEINCDAKEVAEPSLSWSADGESLAFAVEKRIAILRFETPLHKTTSTTTEGVEVNGNGNGNGKSSP